MSKRPGVSLEGWFPLVEKAMPWAVPKTEILRTDQDLAPLLYAGDEDAPDVSSTVEHLETGIQQAVARIGGYPVFLRTGLTSGKHSWRETCYLTSDADIGQHIYNIVEYSELVDMMGLATDVWVVRELLPTKPAFYAFEGMPITAERRYFVVGGRVVGHTPYWPPEAFEEQEGLIIGWRQMLDELNAEDESEVAQLTKWSELVGAVLPGAWSIDWLWTDRGWFLTDMAWAEQSFVWWDHPSAPERSYEGKAEWVDTHEGSER